MARPVQQKGEPMGEDMNQAMEPMSSMACCGRQNGPDVLREAVKKLRAKADRLEVICDMLPAKPTAQQEYALWELGIEIMNSIR